MSEKLAAQGIFILPNIIEHETYAALAELLLTRDSQITLYCAGDGGSIRDALAMVDLIKAHGSVIGMLAGTAASCHGVIWAGCAERLVYPNGVLCVHKVGYSELGRGLDTATAGMLTRELRNYEHKMAHNFADADIHSPDWWYEKIQGAGSQEYCIFTADELVEMGMARPAVMRVGITSPLSTNGDSGDNKHSMMVPPGPNVHSFDQGG